MEKEQRWLTIGETARYIGMSVGFLRNAVRTHSIPFSRVGSKSLRFDRAVVDQWMAMRTTAESGSEHASAELARQIGEAIVAILEARRKAVKELLSAQ